MELLHHIIELFGEVIMMIFSENITIKNYDGGSIASETSVTLKFRFVEDLIYIIIQGATLKQELLQCKCLHFS